jgi:hypothetical protein
MIAVFAGISLGKDALASLPGATLLPPIARGDLGNAFDEGFRVFGIVDGVFDQTRAVAPSEILEVMRLGARLLGSSSMGALRAAELDHHGMIGVGRVYELVRRSPAFRDDWLGHMFNPISFAHVTLPFIEIVGAIGSEVRWEARRLDALVSKLESARTVRFDQLTPEVTEDLVAALPVALRRPVARRVARLWRNPRAGLKGQDALALVRRIETLMHDVARNNERLRAAERQLGTRR